MESERSSLQIMYKVEVYAAHEAFRQKDSTRAAEIFLKQGEIATKLYELEGTDTWDLRTYFAYNAAGWELEPIGNFETASTAYRLALDSCKRIAIGRSHEWQKNIEHLESMVERAESQV